MLKSFQRLSAQTYSRLGNLLGPLITCIKALASHSCEIANVNELEEDLRDKNFVHWARVFIVNLKRIKDIKSFRGCWVRQGFQLLGFLIYIDGGRIGMGDSICAKNGEDVEKALCIANWRLSKHNIVAHCCGTTWC